MFRRPVPHRLATRHSESTIDRAMRKEALSKAGGDYGLLRRWAMNESQIGRHGA